MVPFVSQKMCIRDSGDGVDNTGLRCQRRVAGHLRLVDHKGAAPGRDRDASDGHGRSGVDGRSGLQCAVHIVPNAARQIGQRIQSRSAKGVAAQIVGNGQARQGRDAAVGKACLLYTSRCV